MAHEDAALRELASKYRTIPEVIAYIRSLPQRDDSGNPEDGPRLYQCDPDQRLRAGTTLLGTPDDPAGRPNPNCFERALLFVQLCELIAPENTYQLATVQTKAGLHTFPLVNGKAIVLDPDVTQECLDCGLALSSKGPVGIEPRNAIAWVVNMAGEAMDTSGHQLLRNGPSQLYLGKNALRRLVDDGDVPQPREIDALGFLFALAERAAHRYGARAVGIVSTVTRAISDILDTVIDRRNAHLNIGGLRFDTPSWLDDTAGALGHVGVDVGSAVLRRKLDAWDLAGLVGLPGGTAGILGLLESELQHKGRTLGSLARPPELATFRKFAAPRPG
jgi:hypothetical protein